jgi:hypothetical protein
MSRVQLVAGLCLSLAAAQAQELPNPEFRDTAIIPSFQKVSPRMAHFTTLLRRPVSEELDLLVIRGGGPKPGWQVAMGAISWMGPDDLLGLFLQDRARPGLVYELAIMPGTETEGELRVERATPSELVLVQYPEKGLRPPNLKFFFDVPSKSLRQSIRYYPFTIQRVLEQDGEIYFVAGNRRNWLVIHEAGGPQRFEVLPDRTAAPLVDQVRILGSRTPSEEPSYLDPRPETIDFGPGEEFHLTTEDNASWGHETVLIHTRGSETRRIPLPQSSIEEWEQARPGEPARYGSGRPSEIREEIGPAQLAADRLWLGKSFYDSEGISGVGGFGYFDTANEEFALCSPPEIRDWSVSSLLVENDAVWLGLMHRGEWGDTSGGLLRWDRRQERVERYEFAPIVHTITRRGPLYLGTSEGLAIFENGRFQEFRVDQALNGSFQVIAKED